MKTADLYEKVIVWSNEDNCFIGTCPELMDGGIHGPDELEVFKELSVAIEEVIEIYREDDIPLPKPRARVLEAV